VDVVFAIGASPLHGHVSKVLTMLTTPLVPSNLRIFDKAVPYLIDNKVVSSSVRLFPFVEGAKVIIHAGVRLASGTYPEASPTRHQPVTYPRPAHFLGAGSLQDARSPAERPAGHPFPGVAPTGSFARPCRNFLQW
jgi:hypothetical protein